MAEGKGAGALEKALARAELSSQSALKASGALTASLKKLRGAAREGKLKDLRASLETIRQAVRTVDQEVSNAVDSFEFSDEAYLADGFTEELIHQAADVGLRLVKQDNRLYCYPALLRVLPTDRVVLIDKVRERRLRPSVLVAILRDLQKRPPRFRPAEFLESLYAAYQVALAQKGRLEVGTVVQLTDLHSLLTMLPGQAQDYSLQEFARDIYLLDESAQTRTKSGRVVDFHASTGTKLARATLSVVTQNGTQKPYYGVSFTGPAT
jgi:hypothetical protein